MSMFPGEDPADERRAAAAHLLLNRIALGLIADARRGGGFGEDEKALQARAVELAKKFAAQAGTKLKRSRRPVSVALLPGGQIELEVPFDRGSHALAGLREDGFVLSGSTSRGGGRARTIRPEDMPPEAREAHRREQLAAEARRGKPRFRGAVYRRTVPAPRQRPTADLRILAVQIFDDGFYVDFTYDNEVESQEQLESMFWDMRPPMRVEDDCDTDYYEAERATYGGGPVSFSTFSFAPTPPAEATVLRITTDGGTVEIDLTG